MQSVAVCVAERRHIFINERKTAKCSLVFANSYVKLKI